MIFLKKRRMRIMLFAEFTLLVWNLPEDLKNWLLPWSSSDLSVNTLYLVGLFRVYFAFQYSDVLLGLMLYRLVRVRQDNWAFTRYDRRTGRTDRSVRRSYRVNCKGPVTLRVIGSVFRASRKCLTLYAWGCILWGLIMWYLVFTHKECRMHTLQRTPLPSPFHPFPLPPSSSVSPGAPTAVWPTVITLAVNGNRKTVSSEMQGIIS